MVDGCVKTIGDVAELLLMQCQGKIPVNEYGNVEIFQPWMLPKGTVHIRGLLWSWRASSRHAATLCWGRWLGSMSRWPGVGVCMNECRKLAGNIMYETWFNLNSSSGCHIMNDIDDHGLVYDFVFLSNSKGDTCPCVCPCVWRTDGQTDGQAMVT